MRLKKAFFIPGFFLPFLAGVFLIAALIAAAPCAHAASNPKYASIVMDADTGMILHQSNPDKPLHPASLVKMMTLLMAFDELERGNLSLRDRVVMSKHAAGMAPSKLGLNPGESLRVEDAIYALVTKSANDVAVALGEKLGGTESNFAAMMTRRAREIGMTRTVFRNASGLHNPQQVTTVRDMAKLARYLMDRYPQYYHYFSTREFTYQGRSYYNHNRLMSSYSGMDGLKTGYIQPSGFNLAATARRGNRRLIGVVFGGRTAQSRNTHMAKLLDEGFVKLNKLVVASVPVPPRKPDLGGVQLASLDVSKKATLRPALESAKFEEMIGEGDYDPAVSKRFETGLMAIAAVRENGLDDMAPAAGGDWAIQVGAFESRVKTDKAIKIAQQSLPPTLAGGEAVIVPLKTGKGWLFRARMKGYSKDDALRACRMLKDCLPISPQAY